MTVFGVTYTMTGAPKWVRHKITTLTDAYGTNLDTSSPKSVKVTAHRLGRMFGV